MYFSSQWLFCIVFTIQKPQHVCWTVIIARGWTWYGGCIFVFTPRCIIPAVLYASLYLPLLAKFLFCVSFAHTLSIIVRLPPFIAPANFPRRCVHINVFFCIIELVIFHLCCIEVCDSYIFVFGILRSFLCRAWWFYCAICLQYAFIASNQTLTCIRRNSEMWMFWDLSIIKAYASKRARVGLIVEQRVSFKIVKSSAVKPTV